MDLIYTKRYLLHYNNIVIRFRLIRLPVSVRRIPNL
jgi:hypothetical protein